MAWLIGHADTTTQDFRGAYPASTIRPRKIVLHTTEGKGWIGDAFYRPRAPHFTALADFATRKLRWRQHLDTTVSARTLVNLAGGVETNKDHCIQIELIGTSGWAKNPRPNYPAVTPVWPEAPDWMLRELARFLTVIRSYHPEIPAVAPIPFDPHNAVRHRMSPTKWTRFAGICGHQHVPENDHTDPGALDIATVLRYMTADTSPAAGAAERTPFDMSKLTRTAYNKTQKIPANGKEINLATTEAGHWQFHATPGPALAIVQGSATMADTANAHVVIVRDNDKADKRQWVGRAPLIPGGTNSFQVFATTDLAAGETLRAIAINHSGAELTINTLQTEVMS